MTTDRPSSETTVSEAAAALSQLRRTQGGEVLDSLPCMVFLEVNGELIAANLLAGQMTGVCESVPTEMLLSEVSPSTGEGFGPRFQCLLEGVSGERIKVSGAAQSVPALGEGARLIVLMELEGSASSGEDLCLQELFDSAPEAKIIVQDSRVLRANREFLRMFEYRLEECIGADTHDLIFPQGRDHESEILSHMVMEEGRAAMDSVRRTSAGRELDVSINIVRVQLGSNAMGQCVSFRDIGSQKQVEARLQYASLHDPLTGLANRVLFLDRVTLTMARLIRRPDRHFAVVFLDVDHFKKVNDRYGHAAGDAVLLAVTERLRSTVRPQDTVARFGGDEFALLLDDAGGRAEIDRLANRVQTELRRPVDIGGTEVLVSASMGIALSSIAYESADEIMHDADMAMYEAKAAGKACHKFFGNAMAEDAEYAYLHMQGGI
jgi:diguanylate cyclase (GGDEF)-like protein/PAS domain S-box-containing protein